MKRINPLKGVLTALILALALGGCAPAVKTRMLAPAKAHEAAKLKKLAVLPFAGEYNRSVSADVEAALVGIMIDGQPFFNIVERSQIDRIIAEQHFQYGGYGDDTKGVQIGKIAGAQGIVLGTVTQANAEDKYYQESRNVCEVKNNEGKCIRWGTRQITCTERAAIFNFIPKVVKVETGEVAASESLSGYATSRACPDSSTPLRGRQELIQTAKKQAIAKFTGLVAPHYVELEIKLLTSDDTKMAEDVKKLIDNGVTWAENSRLDRACDSWNQAAKQHQTGYALPYLQGVCAEMSGDLDVALAYYQKADRNTAKPVEEIATAMSRVTNKIASQKKVQEQMRSGK